MAYNAQGRMSSYASATITSATYAYDATGQRTKSIVTPSGGTATTTTYAYEGLALLRLSATQGSSSWKIEYLYDEEGALSGGVYRAPASSTSPTYFSIVTNDHGDVLALCDADGNAFAAYRYDAWGSPQGAGSAGTGFWTQSTSLVNATLAGQIAQRQVLRYADYACDSESGFYYCSARYYDPATRQWTTGDPAKADGEESAYQYCEGEPIGATDPSGAATYKFAWPATVRATAYFKKVLQQDAAWAQHHGLYDLAQRRWGNSDSWDFKMNTSYPTVNDKKLTRWNFSTPIPYSVYSTSFKVDGNFEVHYAAFGELQKPTNNGTRIRQLAPDDFGNLNFGYTARAFREKYDWMYLGWCIAYSKARGNKSDWKNRQNETRDEAMIKWGWLLFPKDRWKTGGRSGYSLYSW